MSKRTVVILTCVQGINTALVAHAGYTYTAVFAATCFGAFLCRLIWHDEIAGGFDA